MTFSLHTSTFLSATASLPPGGDDVDDRVKQKVETVRGPQMIKVYNLPATFAAGVRNLGWGSENFVLQIAFKMIYVCEIVPRKYRYYFQTA